MHRSFLKNTENLRALRVFYNKYLSENKELYSQIAQLTGFTPSNVALYKLAFRHSSSATDASKSNERLEYLGDAVLDTIISSYLFKKYPKQGEGYLTETRAKIVSRKKLGEIASNLGLQEVIEYNRSHVIVNPTIMGNALEALIGAVFLDGGYKKTQQFIIQKMIIPFIDLDAIQETEYNYKSKILEWSQKFNHRIEFETLDQQILDGNNRLFTIGIKVDGQLVCKANGKNKKSAQKNASRKAFEKLNLKIEGTVEQ